MAFCDFCACESCQTGEGIPHLSHAKTSDGRWICDVCYAYDECVRAQRAKGEARNPCKDRGCEHRPKIVGEWSKRE